MVAVDGIKRRRMMATLMGENRNWALDLCQRRIGALRERLLDQRHAGLRTGSEIALKVGFAPSLVGIDNEFGRGRGAPHRRNALGVVTAAAKFDFEQGAASGA